jgi:hypothetical protein
VSDKIARTDEAIVSEAMQRFPISESAQRRAAKLLAAHFAAVNFAGLQDEQRVRQLVDDYVAKRERARAPHHDIGEELVVFGKVLGFFALSKPEYQDVATRALRNWRNATAGMVMARIRPAGTA